MSRADLLHYLIESSPVAELQRNLAGPIDAHISAEEAPERLSGDIQR